MSRIGADGLVSELRLSRVQAILDDIARCQEWSSIDSMRDRDDSVHARSGFHWLA